MEKVAVVILTHNEELRIKRTLDSVKKLTDEIIIVDDMSTDGTCSIAREYGATIVERVLNNDFAAQRNAGADAAEASWIMQMDADEELSDILIDQIKSTLSQDQTQNAFEMIRLNFFIGKPIHHAGAKSPVQRLYRKGKAHYEGVVHEQLIVDGDLGFIDGEIFHYPVETINDTMMKALHYTDLEAERFVDAREYISYTTIRDRLLWKPIKLFWKLYVKKKGYKDGMHGLMWCMCNVIGPQILWLKIWEKAYKSNRLTGIEKELS